MTIAPRDKVSGSLESRISVTSNGGLQEIKGLKRYDSVELFSVLNSREYDPYPILDHFGCEIIRLPGMNRPIYISPLQNDCGIDGKRMKSKWFA